MPEATKMTIQVQKSKREAPRKYSVAVGYVGRIENRPQTYITDFRRKI